MNWYHIALRKAFIATFTHNSFHQKPSARPISR